MVRKHSAFAKTIVREVRESLGRYLAIFAIIALGVGFFCGLRTAKPAMIRAGQEYFDEHGFFDFRLISTLGLTEEDAAAFRTLSGVVDAEGAYAVDFLRSRGDGTLSAHKALSISERINTLQLFAGRMPARGDECLADRRRFSEQDIGTTVVLAEENPEETQRSFAFKSYTIVGLCDSPLYLNTERGTTTLPGGALSGFLYLRPDGFALDCYTDLYLTVEKSGGIYTKTYEKEIDALREPVQALLEERAQLRYEALLQTYGVTPELAASTQIPGLSEPETYVLGRDTNTGYVCFDNDSSIVAGVSKVFPLFFFLVAALVCMTTMTRMVEEQRTQIGTLRAIGYSAVVLKYVFYSGSAALLGGVTGFLIGSWIFPLAIWRGYSVLYDFAPLSYHPDYLLGAVSLLVSLGCSAGTTYISCRRQLRQAPAQLMRPRAPANGKRILLEHIPFVWKRLSFLHKVTARNIFRYKKRLFMMVLGIGGCTALVLTGLGLRDSICNIAEDQFGKIMKYDYTISFREPMDEAQQKAFVQETADELTACVFFCKDTVDVASKSGTSSVNLIAASDPAITQIFDLHLNGKRVAYPPDGSVVISRKAAEKARISVGDTVTLQLTDTQSVKLPVSGIFENYVYNYILMTEETYTQALGRQASYRTAYAQTAQADLHRTASELVNEHGATSVEVTQDLRTIIDDMLGSMNAIVVLVIASAAALAFIVLFNLSNINLTEREREIATIQVLGFYPSEAGSYVFRENLILTAIGAFVGLFFGYALLHYVMLLIDIDIVSFDVRISALSYVAGIALTFAFALLVDLVMRKKLGRISLTEALKSVE